MKTKYHIDVTPEEELLYSDIQTENTKHESKTLSFFSQHKGALSLVVGIHLALITSIFALSPPNSLTDVEVQATKNSNGSVNKEENKTNTSNQTVGVSPTDKEPPIPNLKQDSSQEWPQKNMTPRIVAKPEHKIPDIPKEQLQKSQNNKTNEKLKREYKVKQGDTLYSIAKKYKLSLKKLKELNRLNDNSTIKPNQMLKLM